MWRVNLFLRRMVWTSQIDYAPLEKKPKFLKKPLLNNLISPYDSTIQTLQFYLVLKNFGSSSARITSFECDFDLSQISYEEFGTPFSRIVGTELAPGQKIYTAFAPMKFITFMEHWRSQHEQPFLIVFKLSYTSDSGLEYDEEVSINLSYSDDLTSGRPTIDSIDKALTYSMHALEQIAENNI